MVMMAQRRDGERCREQGERLQNPTHGCRGFACHEMSKWEANASGSQVCNCSWPLYYVLPRSLPDSDHEAAVSAPKFSTDASVGMI